jgi:predicted acetyltransferase
MGRRIAIGGAVGFEFREWGLLSDGVVDLAVETVEPADPVRGRVPCYHFRISRHGTARAVGSIRLRVGHVEAHPVLAYAGHVGYEIDEMHRGHGYAGRACRLLRPVALAHGLDRLVITCSPVNAASRRTIENIGATFLGVFDVPTDSPAYRDDRRSVCRFEWWLADAA